MRKAIAGLATLASVFALSGAGYTHQGSGAESDAHTPAISKHYFLPATPQNVQWGWYDPQREAKADHQLR